VDQPVFALRSRAIHAVAEEHDSLEAMLSEYLAAIQACHPRGPYILLGWGFGATLAHLAAARLEEKGCEVALVAAWDPPPQGEGSASQARLAASLGWTLGRALQEMDRDARNTLLGELATLGGAERAARLEAWARDPERLAGDVLPETLERLARLATKHVALLEGAALPRIAANVHAIASSGAEGALDAWRRATRGRFDADVVEVGPDGHLLDSGLDEAIDLLKVHLFTAQGLGGFA
jgi:thioesterase domain-containing protein